MFQQPIGFRLLDFSLLRSRRYETNLNTKYMQTIYNVYHLYIKDIFGNQKNIFGHFFINICMYVDNFTNTEAPTAVTSDLKSVNNYLSDVLITLVSYFSSQMK